MQLVHSRKQIKQKKQNEIEAFAKILVGKWRFRDKKIAKAEVNRILNSNLIQL